MSLIQKCPGLINSTDHGDIVPLRVAVLNGCYFTLVAFFNIIINAMKRPFILTYCDSYGVKNSNGTWTGILGELMNNRSDFSANIAEVNHVWYQDIQYSPAFGFGNAITILSGKILANNANGLSILSSFSSDIWLSFCIVIVVIAICYRILHMEYSKWRMQILRCARSIYETMGRIHQSVDTIGKHLLR